MLLLASGVRMPTLTTSVQLCTEASSIRQEKIEGPHIGKEVKLSMHQIYDQVYRKS